MLIGKQVYVATFGKQNHKKGVLFTFTLPLIVTYGKPPYKIFGMDVSGRMVYLDAMKTRLQQKCILQKTSHFLRLT